MSHPFVRALPRLRLGLVLSLVLLGRTAGAAPGAPGAPGTGGDPRLEQAEALLRGPTEDKVRAGAMLCAEIDSAESMEVLLKVLKGTQPHYRDIAWEGLIAFRSAPARAVVAGEVEKPGREQGLRQWCAQLLGVYAEADGLRALTDACADKQPEVRAAAAQALGSIRQAEGTKPLLKLAGDKDPHVRSYAREALARIDPSAHGAALRAGLTDKDAGARCFALGCVARILPDEVEALSAASLDDADWRVRMQAAQNLAAVKSKANVARLVEHCGDARPVVRAAIRSALLGLTGHGWYDPAQWTSWWAKVQANFDFAPDKAAPAGDGEGRSVAVKYHDLPVDSNHIAFLIDVSQEMQAESTSAGMTKAQAAQAELARVLELLQGKVRFNVFAYDTTVRALAERPIDLDGKQAKRALAFIEDANARGPKDIWGALETATQDPDLDTIYLLASGEPEVGLYVHYNRIVLQLRERQRFGKFVVHGVVYTHSDWYARQIEEISRSTGGEFRRVE